MSCRRPSTHVKRYSDAINCTFFIREGYRFVWVWGILKHRGNDANERVGRVWRVLLHCTPQVDILAMVDGIRKAQDLEQESVGLDGEDTSEAYDSSYQSVHNQAFARVSDASLCADSISRLTQTVVGSTKLAPSVSVLRESGVVEGA